MVDWAGQRVLVTGASAGIGAGLAEEFARRGAVVGICARREERLAEVLGRCREHSPDSRMWVADLSDPAAVDRLAASALEELGRVDVLVNNAGIPKRRHVTRLDPATVEAVMNINYLSPVRLTLALLPSMLERGSGRIVNLSSVAATLSSPGESAYDASKAAMTAFSEAMAIDLWNTGVKILVVYPGLVDTELFTLPDNDPVVDPTMVPIPVAELVEGVFEALDQGVIQVYVPGWFADLASGKAANVEGFISGAAEFVAQQSKAVAVGRRQPRALETRRRIMDAALELFAERGYGAVAIEDIAEAAGLTKGAVYYWFADKDDLGRDLQHELYERLTDQALGALDPEGDIVTNMRRAFRVYLDALGSLGQARFFLRDAWTIPALDEGGRRDQQDAVAMVRGHAGRGHRAGRGGGPRPRRPGQRAPRRLGRGHHPRAHHRAARPDRGRGGPLLGIPARQPANRGPGIVPQPLVEGVTMPPTKLGRRDLAHLIHPVTSPRDLAPNGPRMVTAADGYWITDDQGRRLIDGFAGLWCVAVGHGRREIIEAVSAQMATLDYATVFHGGSHPRAIELAERLSTMFPPSTASTT